MDLYEEAKLKGQKLRLATLLHKPEFKQNYLTPIRCLGQRDQCHLLERVVNLELSLSELQTEANQLKQQMALKSAFVKLTNSETWERAQEMFPHFATEEQLTRFLNSDLKKSIPKTFSDFCHRAKCSTAQYEASGIGHLTIRGNTVSTLVSPITEINGNLIKQVDPTFTRASLILLSLPDVASAENVAYTTINEVNSFFGCHHYIAAVMSTLETSQQIAETWKKAFGHMELLLIANTNCKGNKYPKYV